MDILTLTLASTATALATGLGALPCRAWATAPAPQQNELAREVCDRLTQRCRRRGTRTGVLVASLTKRGDHAFNPVDSVGAAYLFKVGADCAHALSCRIQRCRRRPHRPALALRRTTCAAAERPPPC